MKNKKIILLFILVLLISIFGVSFALYNYNKTSKNSKLIVGDIYMHYKESDMSILTTAEDTSNFYYEKDILNPNMKNQEYQELDTRNELTKCADYFKDSDILPFGVISFCKNETIELNGTTIQFQSWINNNPTETQINELKKLNVVLEDNTVNPIMSSQEYVDTDTRNELSKCMELSLFARSSFDSNSTIETFCKGTGTIKGKTLQDGLDEWQSAGFKVNEYLEARNIITSDNKVNPIMASQTYEEKQEVIDTRNELSKCVDYISSTKMPLNEGDTYAGYCKGNGKTSQGKTFQENLNEGNWFSDKILTELKNLNVIFLKKGILSSYSTDKATPNPEMKNQTYEVDDRNELSKCVDYFRELVNNNSSGPKVQSFIPNNKSNVFQITAGILKIEKSNNNNVDDATIIAYCQGTGTIGENTFQSNIDNSKFNSSRLNELKDKNIVTSDNKVNPIMASQTYTENGQNELSKCVDYFVKIESAPNMSNNLNKYLVKQIDTSNIELTTRMINFCQGTGTFTGTEDSYNIQTAINDNYFSTDTYLYDNNVIVYETKTLPYFEFTIDGKNTSNKDINYNIKLAHGDVIENKTENNRLMDKYLIFKLVEVINNEEVELVDNIKYDNINNNIIYKNIISKNTNEEINHTYRLYMIVDPNLMIGNLEGAVYSFEEYANLFASIKVNVDGNYK